MKKGYESLKDEDDGSLPGAGERRVWISKWGQTRRCDGPSASVGWSKLKTWPTDGEREE